jgi:ATF/CREB family transcription factor
VAQPLAPPPPPPPPRPAAHPQNPPESDYFSGPHHNSHFSLEPNPFEQSFGNPSSETPGGKSILPPVASLTSPAPLLGGAASAGGYGWSNSLRSGPLSPAMLGGPVNATDYFDPAIRGSFPTPNESSLRTGLTPGGGGSMFPAPSPNSQALFQQLANGGATPGTLDFHRTAMSAAAARKDHKAAAAPPEKRAPVAPMDASGPPPPQPPAFGQHDNDAANGLYLLAQAGNGPQPGPQPGPQFAVPKPPGSTTAANHPGRSHETSPNLIKRVGTGGSVGESVSGSAGAPSEISGDVSDSGDQSRPATRARGKRAPASKPNAPSNARRKTGDGPAKPPPAKRAKTASSNLATIDMSMDMDGMDSDEEHHIKEEQYHENGKKMTDEEKRKNFLERNRLVPAFPPHGIHDD